MSILPIVVVVIILLVATIVIGFIFSARKSGKNGINKKLKAKDQAQILKEANRRLAVNPKDADALKALGEIYFDEQNWEKAFKTYETLLEVTVSSQPEEEFFLNKQYGLCAVKLEKYEEAYKGFIIANTIKNDSFEVNYNLGYLEFQKKHYEKAVTYFRFATRVNMEDALAFRYLGHSLFKIKNYKEALNYLKRAMDLQPDDKETLFTMAECFHEIGQEEQAIRLFSHLRADPVLGPNAALFAGSINLNQRQFVKAIQDFEIGLKHKDIKVDVLIELKYRLAMALLNQQEISRAVTILGEIQQLYPGYKDVPTQLATYKELNSNRNLQVYLLSAMSDFIILCRKIVLGFFPKAKVKITDISVSKSEWVDILAEVETTRWSDVVLFRMIRSTGNIGELILRDFHARIKDMKAGRGYCLSAGTFSDEAKRFVEARLIDLIEKDALREILNNIDSGQKAMLIED